MSRRGATLRLLSLARQAGATGVAAQQLISLRAFGAAAGEQGLQLQVKATPYFMCMLWAQLPRASCPHAD